MGFNTGHVNTLHRMKICLLCKKEFLVKGNNHAYCSFQCRDKVSYKREYIRLKGEIKERNCLFCDSLFLPKIRTKKYCSIGCQALGAHLKRSYGMNGQEYKNLIDSQGEKCAICRKPFIESKIHIDHDHTTGKIRGALCMQCNFILGNSYDSIDILQECINYLKRSVSCELEQKVCV